MFLLEVYLELFDSCTIEFDHALHQATDVALLEDGLWSAVAIAEHVIKVERNVFLMIPRLTTVHQEAKNYGNDKLKKIIVDLRARKVLSPATMNPDGRLTSLSQASSEWLQLRAAHRLQLLQRDVVVDERTYEHPYLGVMSVSDWLYFLLHHAQRHALQIMDLPRI
jgi:hypothetical protein